ncbi:aspartyl protease family protein [Rhodanobacter sp. A1T4]|jgi:hypothetical protein|uniref:aspartyl protease family protein n=1 Tax=Rhodanobacter sp. A1T4 TaxID=2723087 RepID=UPI0016203533|nr:aspartyl protease family protein [Rhodanobacter sp. A1T4]MBB6247783.1 hypothetical protein [Rhodanobacter sp. A1T4]
MRHVHKTACEILAFMMFLAVPISAGAEDIRLTPTSVGWTIQAVVNGKPGTFLFDTGGGNSIMNPQFAANIGCKPWGQMSGFTMQSKRIDMLRCDGVAVKIGKIDVTPETMGVFDFTRLLPPGSPHIDGSLALDLFPNKTFRYSLTDRVLEVVDSPSEIKGLDKKSSMPVHVVRDAQGLALEINLPVKTPEGTAWFELDSGNDSGDILVGKHLAGLFHLSTEHKKQKVSGSLLNGAAFTGSVEVLDLALDGNLGLSFLKDNDVVVDIPEHRAWVIPRGK